LQSYIASSGAFQKFRSEEVKLLTKKDSKYYERHLLEEKSAMVPDGQAV
jgi:hypothetical protein